MNARAGSQLIKDIVTEKKRLRLDILGRQGQTVGYILPLTRSAENDEYLIRQITAWRNRAKAAFLTQFTATPARTKAWLHEVVLSDDTRLMFLLYLRNQKLIGHTGFRNLTEVSAEGDNQLRGERGGSQDFMMRAQIAICSWMFEALGIRQIHSRVLSNNDYAQVIHQKLGYVVDKYVDLYVHRRKSETHLLEYGQEADRVTGQQLLYLTLNREKFYERKQHYECFRTI